MYGLLPQREYQDRLADELMSPIGQQVLPNSIEYRLMLYKKRDINSNLIKQKFLNYRLLSAKVEANKQTIPSYFLFYSTTTKELTKGKIIKIIGDIGYFSKDEIKFITLKYFNNLLNVNYKTVYDLIYNPPTVEDEIKLRNKLIKNNYDLSTIIILDDLPTIKLEIICNSKIYSDVKEMI